MGRRPRDTTKELRIPSKNLTPHLTYPLRTQWSIRLQGYRLGFVPRSPSQHFPFLFHSTPASCSRASYILSYRLLDTMIVQSYSGSYHPFLGQGQSISTAFPWLPHLSFSYWSSSGYRCWIQHMAIWFWVFFSNIWKEKCRASTTIGLRNNLSTINCVNILILDPQKISSQHGQRKSRASRSDQPFGLDSRFAFVASVSERATNCV